MDANIEIVRPNKNPLMPNLLKAKFEINRARIKTVIGIVRLYDDFFNLAFIDAISSSGFLTQIPTLFFLGPNILSILCGKAGCPAILSPIRFANNALLTWRGICAHVEQMVMLLNIYFFRLNSRFHLPVRDRHPY